MILVTGATGNVGAEVVPLLLDAGEEVRALVRHPSRARLAPGAELARGDLNQPETIRKALTGCQALFLLPGFADMPGLLSEAQAAGVAHVVLLSALAADGTGPDNPTWGAMIASEQAVKASGLRWTILRPAPLMSNTLRWVPQLRAGNVVRAAQADVAVAMIDPYDVAAAGAVALSSSSEHHGRYYHLSGPEPLRPADRVRILGQVLRRDLRFESQPDQEGRNEPTTTMPPDQPREPTPLHPTMEKLTGRPPRHFAQWARANAQEFQ